MVFKIIENFSNIMYSLYPPLDQVVCHGHFTNVRLLMSCSKTYRLTVMTQSVRASCLARLQRRARPLNCYSITTANLIMYYQLSLSSNLSVKPMKMLKKIGKVERKIARQLKIIKCLLKKFYRSICFEINGVKTSISWITSFILE